MADEYNVEAWVAAVREEQRRNQALPAKRDLLAKLSRLNTEAKAIKDPSSPASRDKHAEINAATNELEIAGVFEA